MKTHFALATALVVLPLWAFAQNETPAPDLRAFGGRVVEDTHRTAIVASINSTTREVTLQESDGAVLEFTAGADVQNFAQMGVGDKVDMVTNEELTVIVTDAGGEPERTDTMDVSRAPKGEKPGVLVTKRSKGVAVIEGIDYAARTVTLKGPNRSVTIKVGPEAVSFDKALIGDRVLIDYVQNILIVVRAP